EGRGTTRPLEVLGAPDIEPQALLSAMAALAPQWMRGCRLRPCSFEPAFQKHSGELCAGFQIHVEDSAYDHGVFRPWRLIALALKALRTLNPAYDLWGVFPYKYEYERRDIDLIKGSETWREWVDDPPAASSNLDAIASRDEEAW